MNFNNATSDKRVGSKTADRKSNLAGEDPGQSKLDREAMDSAQRAQDRMIKNENSNSSNSLFTK
jgi:hypothetical protein